MLCVLFEGLRNACVLHMVACVEASCSVLSSFPSSAMHYMHATSFSCGDVLQMGGGRILQQSLSSHALVRFRAKVGVAWVGALTFVHDSG